MTTSRVVMLKGLRILMIVLVVVVLAFAWVLSPDGGWDGVSGLILKWVLSGVALVGVGVLVARRFARTGMVVWVAGILVVLALVADIIKVMIEVCSTPC